MKLFTSSEVEQKLTNALKKAEAAYDLAVAEYGLGSPEANGKVDAYNAVVDLISDFELYNELNVLKKVQEVKS